MRTAAEKRAADRRDRDLVPNRPTPEGRELGAEVARLADRALKDAVARFEEFPERCKSCAFRGGTVPNGCPPTLLTAIECCARREIFMCHEQDHLCVGWAAIALAGTRHSATPIEVREAAHGRTPETGGREC